MISPETGIMIQQRYGSTTYYTIPCQNNYTDGASIMLPLPDLDHVACTKFPFYTMESSIEINPSLYNTLFSFVHDGNTTIKSTTIANLSLMVIMAIAFFGIMTFYCMSLKKIEDDDDANNEMK